MLNILSASPQKEVEQFLKKAGYEILEKRKKESIIVRIDDRDHLGSLEAEYIVRKAKKSFVVVERKGETIFDPTEPGLRRRLLELHQVFGLNGLLLVDRDNNEIHEVTFKFPRERGLEFYLQFLLGLFLILGIIGIIWVMINLKLL